MRKGGPKFCAVHPWVLCFERNSSGNEVASSEMHVSVGASLSNLNDTFYTLCGFKFVRQLRQVSPEGGIINIPIHTYWEHCRSTQMWDAQWACAMIYQHYLLTKLCFVICSQNISFNSNRTEQNKNFATSHEGSKTIFTIHQRMMSCL